MNWSKSFYISMLVLLVGFSGSVLAGQGHAVDHRQEIKVDKEAKEHVLLEMRQLLETVHNVMDSALKKDMDAVNKYASAVGLKAMKATPPSVAKQLPKEFKMMGRSVHEAMDGIARDARDLGDSQHTIEQVTQTLGSCVACHSMYKFQ